MDESSTNKPEQSNASEGHMDSPAQQVVDSKDVFAQSLVWDEDLPGPTSPIETEPVEKPADEAQVPQTEEEDTTTTEVEGESEIEQEPKEEVKEETDDSDTLRHERWGSKFAALSRKEKDLRIKEQELAAREQEIKDLAQIKDRIKSDPLSTLSDEFGLTFDEIAKMQLAQLDGNDTPIRLKQLENKFEQRFAELQKREAEQEVKLQQSKHEEAITQFKSQISDAFDAGDFPAAQVVQDLGFTDMIEQAYEVVNQHYEQTGRILTPQEALQGVEKYYAPRLKDKGLLKKVEDETETETVQTKQVEQPKSNSKSKTLSNEHTKQVSPPEPDRPLTPEEEHEKFMNALQWE